MKELITVSTSPEFVGITRQDLSLIAFGTPWSSPCRRQYQVLVNFMRIYNGELAIARVDVERHPEIARKCHIQTVPTLIVYRKSREVKRAIGLQSVQTLTVLLQASLSNGNLESPPSLNPEH
ncbi:thioredoxin family protein [Desulfocastanea catecholica]